MKVIESIEKDKKGYQVTIQAVTYLIVADIYYKYHLQVGDALSQKQFKAMLDENQLFLLDQLAVQKLKKMLTVQELELFLKKEGANQKQIETLVTRYKRYQYLDDQLYAKTYVEKKKYSEGPKLIELYLKQKGLSDEDIQQALTKLDQKNIISMMIDKRLSTIKNKNKNQMFGLIKNYLLQKGFDDEILDEIIEMKIKHIKVNDEELIKKEIQKVVKKYQNKLDAQALEVLIKQKLYQKGFLMNDIEKCLNE
jgi:regulatory protein